jgi:hypothetical protein
MRAIIVGDVWPRKMARQALAARLGLGSREEVALFLWTLDATVAGGLQRANRTILTFAPADLEGLTLGRRNVVVAGSNHLGDTGPEGVIATLEALEASGLDYVGAGRDECRAKRPLVCETDAGRIAVLAFAETEPWVGAIAADRSLPGVWPFEIDACAESVAAAARQADHVWVYLHWGHEFVRFPEPRQRRAVKRLAEAGATLVVASHTHVALGRERFGATEVFYGLGNFLFPDILTERGYRSRWDRVSRTGLMLDGTFARRWSWTVKEIRLDRQGLPECRPGAGARLCPDYGAGEYADVDRYDRLYPSIRRREAARYAARRMVAMTWGERIYRVGQCLGVRQGGADV